MKNLLKIENISMIRQNIAIQKLHGGIIDGKGKQIHKE
jgi:hypothetical protein